MPDEQAPPVSAPLHTHRPGPPWALRSLRSRIAFFYMILALAPMLALGLALVSAEEQAFQRTLDRRLETEARLAAAALAVAHRAGAAPVALHESAARLAASAISP
ncbi:MAG: hypothetical protein U0531_04150 [Dehalococcoidia bacterium]